MRVNRKRMDDFIYARIHIMGGAGSGKTTLCCWLTATLGYPCYELDQIGWTAAGKVPLEQRLVAIEQILAQQQWITEGVFLWWTERLLAEADVIVWLDLPFSITGWRIIKRHVLASWHGNNHHAGVMNLLRFTYSVGRAYYMKEPVQPQAPDDDFAITRAATKQILSNHTEKLIHCRRQNEIKQFQEQVMSLAAD
jgi:adenylate kinase family enzyme